MRLLSATLYQNDGTVNLSSSQGLEARIVDGGLGRLAWDVDDELTKVNPGDLTVRIADEDETVWTWLQTQIATMRDGSAQFFPPWLVVYADEDRIFVGLLDITSLRRDLSKRELNLAAQHWSHMLQNIYLGDLRRDSPKIERPRGEGVPWVGNGIMWTHTWHQKVGGHDSEDYIERTKTGYSYPNLVTIPSDSDILNGDYVVSDLTGLTQYKVLAVWSPHYHSAYLGQSAIALDGWDWVPLEVNSTTFTRVPSALDDDPYYVADSGVISGNALKLVSVDGLAPGDALRSNSGVDIRISDIDTERKEIISPDPITAAFWPGEVLYLSDESSKQLVYEDALDLMTRIAYPYAMDFSRYTPATLVQPLFAWQTLRNVNGQDLLQISDMEPNLNEIRALGGGASWSGTPETGYVQGSLTTRFVDWTRQLAAAPARLVPDEGPVVAADDGSRNRNYFSWKWWRTRYLTSAWAVTEPVYTPRNVAWPASCVGYDHTLSRRIVVTNPESGESSASEQRWNGSAWSGATVVAWPVAGWHPCSLVPFPGVAATGGPVAPQGQAMLALSTDGANVALQLIWAAAPAVLWLDTSLATGARLRTTPWGVFLVGPGGYGRITYSGGELSISWCAVGDVRSTCLLDQTLCALDADSVWCFARFDRADPTSQGKVITETRLLQLTSSPVAGADPVLFSEKVISGTPRIAVAFRDPSDPTRILGLLGGRMFQIGWKLPRIIERVRLDGLNGGELLEHIGQYLNALVVPRSDGVVELVSRNQPGTPVDITVDRTSVTQSRMSPHFFSVVRVSGEEDDLYADAFGITKGGKILEISNNPCIWTEGGCFALASSYASSFGFPRGLEEQSWIFEDANTAPPWEAIPAWTPVRVNGIATVWMFAGADYDVIKGETKVTLLERP